MANTTMKMVFLNRSPPSAKQGMPVVGWTVIGDSLVVLVSFVTSANQQIFFYSYQATSAILLLILLTHYNP